VIGLAVVVGAGVPSKEIAFTAGEEVLVLMDVSRWLGIGREFEQRIWSLDWMPDGKSRVAYSVFEESNFSPNFNLYLKILNYQIGSKTKSDH
jgi:elongation factor P hydroxylase